MKSRSLAQARLTDNAATNHAGLPCPAVYPQLLPEISRPAFGVHKIPDRRSTGGDRLGQDLLYGLDEHGKSFPAESTSRLDR